MISSKIDFFFIELTVDSKGVVRALVAGKFAHSEFVLNQSIFTACPFLEGTLEGLVIDEPCVMEGMVIVSNGEEYNVDVELFNLGSEVSILIHDRTNVYKYVEKLNQNRNDLFFLKRELNEKNIELERLRKIADQANEEKSRFLAMMSHEIKNPLNVILGYTELVNKENISKTIKKYLKYLTISGKNLKVIVDDILDLSRFEAGKLHLSKSAVNLNHVVDQLINDYKYSHGDRC